FDVGLLNRGEVANYHAGQRADPHDRLPTAGDGTESGHENAQQNRERGGLGADGKESGNRSGRALIDVRGPDLERSGGNLEAESDEHQRGSGAGKGQRRSGSLQRAADV